MRPQSLRRDRQRQYNYMNQGEYEQELKKQVEEKRRLQMQEKVQNTQEILNHYKNYQLGGDQGTGEDSHYMQDLNQLLRNKEMEIERLGGLLAHPQNEAFSGDMNAVGRNNNVMPTGVIARDGGLHQEKKTFDLFNDNFIQNYHNPSVKNNENLNIINSIFGNAGQAPQNNAESERERRLKLREMERMKRQEGIFDGGYGSIADQPKQNDVIQPTSATQQNIFGGGMTQEQIAINKREQAWQQKMQQRINSQEGSRVPRTQNVTAMLPINNVNTGVFGGIQQEVEQRMESPNQQMRSSRIFSQLADARKLDQSINLESMPQPGSQSSHSQNPSQNQPQNAGGFFQIGGDGDVMQRRRENEKKQRQQEYQQFLQKQKQRPGDVIQQPISQPTTVPSSSQSNQRPSVRSESDQPVNNSNNPLKNGGLQQLGMHQQRQQEDKLRLQQEYRQQLDMQNQQKLQNKNDIIPPDRKKELSDMVFNEILGSHQKMIPSQITQNDPLGMGDGFQTPIMRGQNGVASNRVEVLQQKQADLPGGLLIGKHDISEEDKRKQVQDKKKEYAMQLQQQMALKQQQSQNVRGRRGSSQPILQQQPSQEIRREIPVYGQQQQQPFEYQNQMMMPPQFQPPQMMAQDIFIPRGADPYSNNFSANAMHAQYIPHLGMDAPSSYMNQPQFQAPTGQAANNLPPQLINQPSSYGQQQALDPQQAAKIKQEEYRRELENQIRLKEEKKKQELHELQAYEQKIEMRAQSDPFIQQSSQTPGIPSQAPMGFQPQGPNNPGFQVGLPQQQIPQSSGAQGQNFQRQRTDVSKINDPQQDQMKAIKQQQYQEELQRQMDERKRQKEEEKRKEKLLDEEHERKMQQEQDVLQRREHQELVKEGRRDPNAPYQAEKKKNVRRDQFEPSEENLTAKIVAPNIPKQQDEPWMRPPDIGAPKESLFGNESGPSGPTFRGGLDLPMNNRREDLFGGAGQPQLPSSGFPGFQLGGDREGFSSGPAFSMMNQNERFQMAPPSYQPPAQLNGAQQDMSGQSKLMEEQSRMILMYQQALEQILQFRNQYFDQAMQMRENIIKEREQLMEYEKMKQQQNGEIQQLQAVYNQLGVLLTQSNQRPESSGNIMSQLQQNMNPQQMMTPILNPQVQNNLNNLISTQRQQIMRMSQGDQPGIFKQAIQMAQKNQNEYPVNQYINPNPVEDQHPNILEQSLSSDTKFVVMAQNKLTQLAGAQQTASQPQQLFSTWKPEELLQQQQQNQANQSQVPLNSTMMKSLAGTSHLVSHFNQTPQKLQNKASILSQMSRPQTSTLPPETIQELPKEEDDQINQSQKSLVIKKAQDEEVDFNSRESSKVNSPERNPLGLQNQFSKGSNNSLMTIQQNVITSTNPLGNTTTIRENLNQIEQMINNNPPTQPTQLIQPTIQAQQQQQRPSILQIQPQLNATNQPFKSPLNKTQEKFQNPAATGSSFYNQTLIHQKQQEQSQMEELQKQLMRIFGNTNSSEQPPAEGNILQQMMQKPATPLARQLQQQANMTQQTQNQHQQQQEYHALPYSNPLARASYNEKLNSLGPEERDLLLQSNINIAESITGTQNMEAVLVRANQKFTSNGFYDQPAQCNIFLTNNYLDQHLIPEEEFKNEPDFDDRDNLEIEEVKMNERPKIYESNKYGRIEESSQQQDVWNDPDLVPPPVVHMNNDDDDYYFQAHDNQSMGGYTGGMNQYNSMIQDGTLRGLQMFSPPSDENNYNLGGYDESHGAEELSENNQYQQFQQQQPDNQYLSHAKKSARTGFDATSEKSMTKKEKDIAEVTKLIQKATDTTNNLFENSDHFKFKIKRDKIQSAQNRRGPNPNSSRKNIKIGDPFRNADSRFVQNNTVNQTDGQYAQNEGQEQDRDNDILSNLDKMISNLQEQQHKNQVPQPKSQQSNRPISGYQAQLTQEHVTEASSKKNRPISAVESQPRIGKYAQMALQQQHQPVNQQHEGRSQRSLGRFAQMAMQDSTSNEQIIQEVKSKYIDENQYQQNEQYQQNHTNILRPVSGKSNSTRYQQQQPGSRQRSKSNTRNQQMYYDEESEDNHQQLGVQYHQEEDANSLTGGFNIGYTREEDEKEPEYD